MSTYRPIEFFSTFGNCASGAQFQTNGNSQTEEIRFFFMFTTFPAGASITGIYVSLETATNGPSVADNKMALIQDNFPDVTTQVSTTAWPAIPSSRPITYPLVGQSLTW
jgi:hypothetical protein